MNRSPWLKQALVALIASAALCIPGLATAAVDMFLKVDGIPGESKDESHKGEIDILSFGWSIAPRTGDVAGRTARACAHDISFVKNVDKASPLLASSAVMGTIIPKVTLFVRKAGEQQRQEFMTVVLTTVNVSSVQHSVSSSSSQLEEFTLNFASATFTYKPLKEDGNFDTPVVGNIGRTC